LKKLNYELFTKFSDDFFDNIELFKDILISDELNNIPLPLNYDTLFSEFEKVVIIRCIRPDYLIKSIKN